MSLKSAKNTRGQVFLNRDLRLEESHYQERVVKDLTYTVFYELDGEEKTSGPFSAPELYDFYIKNRNLSIILRRIIQHHQIEDTGRIEQIIIAEGVDKEQLPLTLQEFIERLRPNKKESVFSREHSRPVYKTPGLNLS